MRVAWKLKYVLAVLWVAVAGHVMCGNAVAGLGDDNWITMYNQNYEGDESNWLLHFKITQERSVLSKLGVNVAYGVTSFMDQGAESSPIKEIYHEPRVYLKGTSWLPSNFTHLESGWWHESNGGGPGPSNRSWDRVYTEFGYTLPINVADASISVEGNVWWIFDEAPENVDIREWEGLSGRMGGTATVILVRNNIGRYVFTIGPSSYEVNWHFNTVPFVDGLETFLRYYDGEGESLLGYNRDSRSVGIGVSLADGGAE